MEAEYIVPGDVLILDNASVLIGAESFHSVCNTLQKLIVTLYLLPEYSIVNFNKGDVVRLSTSQTNKQTFGENKIMNQSNYWKELEVRGEITPFPIEGAKCAIIPFATTDEINSAAVDSATRNNAINSNNVINPNKTSIYLFGGSGRYGVSDTLLYELRLNKYTSSTDVDKWQVYTEKVESADCKVPNSTTHHSLVYVTKTNSLYVYGGTSGDPHVYEWNVTSKKWKSWLPDKERIPEARQDHAVCVVDSNMYMFGGYSPYNSSIEFSELWKFDPVEHKWVLLSAFNKESRLAHPQERYGHILLGDEVSQCLYLVGGCSKGNPLKEIWRYDINKKEWICLPFNFPDINQKKYRISPLKAPLYIPARYGAGVLVGDAIICFGGETMLDSDEGPAILDDLLIFNTKNNCISLAGISNSLRVCYHEMFLLRDQFLIIGGRIKWPYYNRITSLRPYDNDFDVETRENIITRPVFSNKSQIINTEVFDECVEYLVNNALNVEGIFRHSPLKRDVNAIILRYELGIDGVVTHGLAKTWDDSHTVAALLKQYLTALPEPLLTYDVNDKLIEIFAAEKKPNDNKELVQKVKPIIDTIPSENMKLLRKLMSLLHQVEVNSKTNAMVANNLARIFSRALFRAKPGPDAIKLELAQTAPSIKCVEYFIVYYENLFAQ
jgi:hypothetical protein